MPFIRKTYRHLLDRGHLVKDIKPLFLQVIQKQLESKPTIAANQAATTAELELPKTNPHDILDHNDTSGKLDPLWFFLVTVNVALLAYWMHLKNKAEQNAAAVVSSCMEREELSHKISPSYQI